MWLKSIGAPEIFSDIDGAKCVFAGSKLKQIAKNGYFFLLTGGGGGGGSGG